MSAIESKDETVSGVFKDFYVVPNYQREYVWGEPQIEQLLKDIRTEQAEGADAEYFIGSIVVCPRNDGAFDLIDGQQRTTTLFVTLCAIRDHLIAIGDNGTESIRKLIADTITDINGNDSFRARLDPQYEDAGDIFEKLVAGTRPTVNGTRSMRNVATAYNVVRRFLNEEFGSDAQATKGFYGYLVHRVKLIRIRTDSIARALKIFETINDRGIGLDAMDLLKNLLFMQTDPSKFDRLKDRWKKLTDGLFGAGEKPLRFLRYYIFATYGVTKVREDELYDWFVRNEKSVGFSSDPIAFVDKLQDALDAYLNFLKGVGREGQASPSLESISILAGGATRQHLILLLAGRNLPADVFDALCKDTEALLFTYLITRTTNREFEVMFPEWAPGMAKVTNLEEYQTFAEHTLRKRRGELAPRFHREFAALDGRNLRQYQLRYVLGKLTQHVDQAAYGRSAQSTLWLSRYCDGTNVHIEHILPQSPDDDVRAEFGEGADSQELLWSIGNLALAEKSINTSLGRKPFSYKRTIYPQSQFLLTRVIGKKPDIGQTAIDRAVAAMIPFETWTRADVNQRIDWLTALAAETWEIPAVEVAIAEAV
ncbi:protein of unknown function DUF262 [Sphingobium chlorophenolicum L-1]|uniref:DUF262 domain-containing protein n=1 Tax=Sphingobium chlorophenolicum L-1 TaxID=690566 RepID=F6EYN4_SPHCR|nr:DUF262 domain-containing protein [Sphingobium chlorophenolicum]AEG50084.1 protein of unknown function DUF262 [Sphingobium chlorophenolicum L-1]